MKPLKEQALRCAIYTRKSSEEGLEQEFNSLHAQREACEAYVRTQQGEAGDCARPHITTGVFLVRRWSALRSSNCWPTSKRV
jgi:hypothetical protein